jgi:hypothetical protein
MKAPWVVAPNADPQMSKNTLASKHTHEPRACELLLGDLSGERGEEA